MPSLSVTLVVHGNSLSPGSLSHRIQWKSMWLCVTPNFKVTITNRASLPLACTYPSGYGACCFHCTLVIRKPSFVNYVNARVAWSKHMTHVPIRRSFFLSSLCQLSSRMEENVAYRFAWPVFPGQCVHRYHTSGSVSAVLLSWKLQ